MRKLHQSIPNLTEQALYALILFIIKWLVTLLK